MSHTQPVASSSSDGAGPTLDARLQGIIARVRWVSRGVRTGSAIWCVPAAIAGALFIDASRPLPGVVRAVIGILIIVLALRVLWGLIPSRSARRMTALRAARLAEDRAEIRHNALINALQLRPLAAGSSEVSSPVQVELARRAVALGEEQAQSLPLKGMIDTAALKRRWGWALAALAAFALFWLVSPRLFAMGLPRFVQPFADHPPYSPTDFEISWEPMPVLVGDALTVRAHLSRTLPRSLTIVPVDEKGRPLDRSPMTGQIDPASSTDARPSDYTAIVRDLRVPLHFFVQGDTGRSRTFTITPEMRPRILTGELRVTPPAYTNLPEIAHTGITITRDRGPISVLLGSTLTFRARTTVELEGVEHPGSAVTIGASVSGRDAVQQARFDSPGARTLTLKPIGVGGLASHDIASVDVLVVEDRPPGVRVERPASEGEIFVLEGAAFPVEGVASDDVGLTRLTLRHMRRGDGAKPVERDFPVDPDHARSAWASATMTTGDLGASAGDTVTLNFIATDNRAPEFGGPQSTTSATITVRVLGREEFARQFAEQLTAQDITRPYEDLARAAEELDHRAQDLRAEVRELVRDVDRLSSGDPLPEPLERSARALEQRLDQFARERDALASEVRRRLEAPEAVEFDRQMREPLERLLDRLESMQTPDLPALGEPDTDAGDHPDGAQQEQGQEQEPSQDGAQPSEPPQDQASSGEPSPSSESQALNRAQVGQWLDKVEQAAEQDAQQAALASDEAQLDLVRPARALELADQLQRTLEQVDDAARRQRMLADRLATLSEIDEISREELAASQEAIQSQITRAIHDLRTLGDRAAHELGSSESPAALTRAILEQRASVQEGIDAIASATARLPDGLGGQSIRAIIDNSANLVMDEVYQQTLPVTDALSKISVMPARDDEPGADALAPAVDAVRRALGILEQVERYLDEARKAYEQGGVGGKGGGGIVTLRSIPEAIVMVALGAVPGLTDSASGVDGDIVGAIEAARLRIHRLRATLRQVELGLTPLLPTMGNSAQALAESIVSCDAPGMMEGVASALRDNDLARATELAREAAEVLEALYQEPGQSQPGASEQPDMDQELQLRKPSDTQSSSGSGQASPSSQQEPSDAEGQEPTDGHSMNNSQQPSTLDQLARNRQQQQEQGQGQSGGDRSNDSSAQAGGEGSDGEGSPQAGQPSSPGDISQEAEEGQRQRSRYFNEMLYRESELPPELVDGNITDGLPGSQLKRAPGSRSGGASASAPAIPRGLDGPGAAAFIYVPDAYKDVVAAYFERIARESQPKRETP